MAESARVEEVQWDNISEIINSIPKRTKLLTTWSVFVFKANFSFYQNCNFASVTYIKHSKQKQFVCTDKVFFECMLQFLWY